MFLMGMRMKTVMIGAIYQKALLLSSTARKGDYFFSYVRIFASYNN